MLGILNARAIPRRFQGAGPIVARTPGWHGLGRTRRRSYAIRGLGQVCYDDEGDPIDCAQSQGAGLSSDPVNSGALTTTTLSLNPTNLAGYGSVNSTATGPASVSSTPGTVTPSSSSTGGASNAALIASIVGAGAGLATVIAKNLTTPTATVSYNPATGAYTSSTPVGTGTANPLSSLGLTSLTSSITNLLPLLLIGGLAIAFFGAMEKH